MNTKKYRLEPVDPRYGYHRILEGTHVSVIVWDTEHADAILAAMNGEGVEAEARGLLERAVTVLHNVGRGPTLRGDISAFLDGSPAPEAEEHSCRETAEGEGQPPMEKPSPVPSTEDRMIESVDKSAERYSRIAIVNARVAAMQAECAGMVAENNQRQLRGESMAYTDLNFDSMFERYDLRPEAVEKYLGVE